MIRSAFVNIWNKRVGAVAWDENEGTATFEYSPSFKESGLNLAPLTMPLKGAGTYRFREHRNNNTFKGLPGLLADVLPDKYGNALINQWLIRNKRAPNSINPVETLCFIGNRGMGALEFEPTIPKAENKALKLELAELVDISAKILNGRQEFLSHLNDDEEKAMQSILKIGTSAGGARAKALITYNEQTKEVRSGQASAPKGFEHYLIKFDGVYDEQFGSSQGYGRVEMAYYKMALEAGIHMMESRLLFENDRAHFMTKRFDRKEGSEKLHVQTFCALRHFDFQDIGLFSYEQLFETMRMLGLPYPQAEQLFRRMCFNVMARNCDDHTKNFAFCLNQNGEWSLSPAYNICHAYRPNSLWVSQHCLSVNGKRQGIGRDDLFTIARQMNIKKPKQIIDQISQTLANWSNFADEQGVDPDLATSINSTLLIL